MKKLFLLLLAFVAILNASAKSYRGFVDFIFGGTPHRTQIYDSLDDTYYSYTSTCYGMSTTHGIQLNQSWFTGIGVGGNVVNEFKFPRGIFKSGSFTVAPYINGCWNLDVRKSFTPYISIKLGYQINCTSDYITHRNGVYFENSIGVRFRCHSLIGVNAGLTFNPNNPINYAYSYQQPISKYRRFLMCNLGFDF